jgi:hypothetical protein
VSARILCLDLQWRDLREFRSSDELVVAVAKNTPNECSCDRCVALCRKVPCIGTPQEIERLMDAGHGPFLRFTEWVAGYVDGVPRIRMIQLGNTRAGCPMLQDGKCTLHAPGLKPTEGVRATCKERLFIHESATLAVALTWLLECNVDVIRRLSARMNGMPSAKLDWKAVSA